MMFKNEDDLLTPWALYHGALFGFENLRVFDNGSTSARTLDQFAALEARGVAIDRNHRANADFLGKGDLFASVIRSMDDADPADFYLPLDCDEFVGTSLGDGVSCRGDDIREALARHLRHDGALAIDIAYQNIPSSAERFRPAFGALTKTFFARGACRTLDRGFHYGTGRVPGPPVPTALVHIHYHNKPLAILQQHALQKLVAANVDLSPEGLAELHATQGAGWHLVEYLGLGDEDDYRAGFADSMSLALPDFTRALKDVGCHPLFAHG